MTPIITPLLALLKSRKFMVAIFTVLVSVLMQAIPALADKQEIFTALVVMALAIITGITAEDGIKAWAGRPASDKSALTEILTELLDAYFGSEEQQK